MLYLIRRQNIDILNIPIAAITRQYMDYLALMESLRLELAAEYLVMASWLAEIKSRLLLPRPPSAEDGEDVDPRAELVRRLQVYEQFKQAAEDIDRLPRVERDMFIAAAPLAQTPSAGRTPPSVTLDELLDAVRAVMARAELNVHHHIQREPLSVRERMTNVLETLTAASNDEPQQFVSFSSLFKPEQEGRLGVVVTLLAVLELLRELLVELVQAAPFAPIYLRLKTAQYDEQ